MKKSYHQMLHNFSGFLRHSACLAIQYFLAFRYLLGFFATFQGFIIFRVLFFGIFRYSVGKLFMHSDKMFRDFSDLSRVFEDFQVFFRNRIGFISAISTFLVLYFFRSSGFVEIFSTLFCTFKNFLLIIFYIFSGTFWERSGYFRNFFYEFSGFFMISRNFQPQKHI